MFIDYENLTILIIVIITLLYLFIKFKRNKENFEDITYDILTSSSSKPIEIKDIDILNNLECNNLILNDNSNTQINKIDFKNSNLSNVKINKIDKNISNFKNEKGILTLNDKSNLNISNAKLNNLNVNYHYSIDNIESKNLKIIRSDENDYKTSDKDDIKKLYCPNNIKYNNKTLYLTKIEYLDGVKKKEINGIKWKK